MQLYYREFIPSLYADVSIIYGIFNSVVSVCYCNWFPGNKDCSAQRD